MSVFDPESRPPVILPSGTWCYTARIVRWVDGDTAVVDCLVDTGFEEMATKRRRIRLLGVNTPELNDKDPGKRALAKTAHAAVESVAPAGTLVIVEVVKYDKYGGRDDGNVLVKDISLATGLLEDGLGVPYSGGARS